MRKEKSITIRQSHKLMCQERKREKWFLKPHIVKSIDLHSHVFISRCRECCTKHTTRYHVFYKYYRCVGERAISAIASFYLCFTSKWLKIEWRTTNSSDNVLPEHALRIYYLKCVTPADLVYQRWCDIDDHFYKIEFFKRYLFLFFHPLILEETCIWVTLTCGTFPNTDESHCNFTCAANFTCTFKYSQIGNNNRTCTSPDNAPITCRKSRANDYRDTVMHYRHYHPTNSFPPAIPPCEK